MYGREDKKENDLFYLCALIEYIARKTKNRPTEIVHRLGHANLEKIYELADVYHSDNIDDVSGDFIAQCKIQTGDYDNVSNCMYSVPSHWDMGKVYKRLILALAKPRKREIIPTLEALFSSRFIDKIENYNSDLYYQNTATLEDIYRTEYEQA